ncbi:T9SS type B sorting domain-containing protein [Lacinutrix iliipiscaria]|uniref:T9SS type B sorting domain-containing protein n=1 Tax=Lacinutrix iliipiscaria TaxID=1230532 RepID=A0ABW5WNB0_9FLAO
MKSNINYYVFVLTSLFINLVFAQQPTNCVDAVVVCGNSNINLDVSGIGIQELSGSNTCGSQENNSLWLQVSVVTNGTLGFTLTPGSTLITEDYDFFVFGPNVACNAIGQAIRCSTTNPQAAGQTNNLTGMNGTEGDFAEGPGPDGNSFVSWLNVNAGESYFIVIDRPIGNSPFSLEWTGTAQFSEPPNNEATTSTALNLISCDVDAPFDDGFTSFNLEDNTPTIIGSQTDVSVSYHESESDANININALASPYTNTSDSQTIFARLTNDITGCFIIVSFDLNVNLGPDFAEPSDLLSCDNTDDGDTFNGFTFFDLNSKNNEILNGQDPTLLNITYHETMFNAENGLSPLSSPFYNTEIDDQQIYIRIESVTNTDCYSVTTLNLVVQPAPLVSNSTLFQCDEDGIVDGFTSFNLFQAQDELSAGATTVFLKFHTNLLDAQNDENDVDGNNFSNTANPQTIFVQVINEITGCLTITELTLEVSATQILDYLATPVCDEIDSEDGINSFDLNEFTSDIQTINAIPFPVTYYETYEDALLESNQLATPYTNTTPYSQIIFARAEDNNACYGISEVTLTINPLPLLLEDETVFYCLNLFPESITLESGVDGHPNDYTYTWSNGEVTNEIQINEIGTYTVTVTDINGCSKSRTITVEPSNIATIDAVEVVDGETYNTVTVLASGEGIYEYALFNDQGGLYLDFQSSNVLTNVYPGIYTLVVRDVKNNCGDVEKIISVIGFPQYFTPNNDGHHDTWQILGVSAQFQPQTKIKIYNRFGKLLKEISPIGTGWDGTFNGKALPNDDYWFLVNLQDGREYVNHFSLKR